MSDFKFDLIEHALPLRLNERNFLWIWNADKIPPHIGLSCGKEYFSLTVKKSEHLRLATVVRKAKSTRLPLVLVELRTDLKVLAVAKVFAQYKQVSTDVTCLFPVKEVFQVQSTVHQLVDLLNYLREAGEMGQVYGLNLPTDYKGIADYTLDDIRHRIEDLSRSSR